MEKSKGSWAVLCLNLLGLACLMWFAVPYLAHDTTVLRPEAMLPMERWDRAGMALTAGFLPLLGANVWGYLRFKRTAGRVRVLFFLPTAVCAALILHYWLSALL